MSSDALPPYPFAGSTHRGPAPLLRQVRAEQPVARVEMTGGGHAWLITRYDDARAAAADPRFSRAATYRPGAPSFAGLLQVPPGMIISVDPPDHTRLRRLASLAFTPERVAAMRPRIETIAGELLDALPTSEPADLAGGFAVPLAMAVICELLGVPEADRDSFHGWVRQVADVSGPPERAREGGEKLGGYLAGLVASKQAQQAQEKDVLDALIAARDGEDRLSFDELVGLGFTLLGSGFDSCATMLGIFVLTLLSDHPGAWPRLAAHPEEIPAAVEELLRTVNLTAHDTSGLPRIATEDVTIAGVTIPAGDAVFFSFVSANRDEAVFADAERVDLGRTSPHQHLAFGAGIHTCLGAVLARLELATALKVLTRRFPHATLAVEPGALPWRTGELNHCLAALPVQLTAARQAEAA